MMRPIAALFCLALALAAQTQGPIKLKERRPDPPPESVPIPQSKPVPEEKAKESAPPAPSETAAPVKAAPEKAAPEKEKTCVVDFEDPGRPRLKRGRPEDRDRKPICEELPRIVGETRSGEPNATDVPPGAGGPGPEPREPPREMTPIDHARDQAETYSERLPNFICQQLIRRSTSGITRSSWRLNDTVTVDVAYVEGKEHYSNAKRNGKKIEWEKAKETGTWSEGEYATILRDVMSLATNATFTHRGADRLGLVTTEVYDYVVEKDNSHWNLTFGGQTVRPKYRGAIWFDPKEYQVYRIEMEALELPSSFAVSHAETTLDYGPIRIGTRMHVLPTKTENLACFRSESACARNETEFRNYRQFAAESTISTTDSSVTFDGDEKKAPPKKK